MSHKMELFTARARRVMRLAQEESQYLRHNYIGTEHLLLGLLREEDGIAICALRDLGMEQTQIETLMIELTKLPILGMNAVNDLTLSSQKALELAAKEAHLMGHPFIDSEHLLLGLLNQPDGGAIDALKRLGISPAEIRRHILYILRESLTPPNPQIARFDIALQISTGNTIYQEFDDVESLIEFLQTYTQNPAEILKRITPRDE